VQWSYKRAIVSPSIVQAVNRRARACFENKILSRRILRNVQAVVGPRGICKAFDIEKSQGKKAGLKQKKRRRTEVKTSSHKQYNIASAKSLPDLFCGAMRKLLDDSEKIWLNR